MVTVVTGPPCSGKTTYVKDHAKPGDIVIDYDRIARAFGSPTSHQHSPPIRHVTTMARRAAIDAALTVREKADAWIVDCNPTAARLAEYQKVGAVIVTMRADQDELHRRAGAERPRLWHKLINEWQPTSQSVVDPSPVRATKW